jgi:hypothetical protein
VTLTAQHCLLVLSAKPGSNPIREVDGILLFNIDGVLKGFTAPEKFEAYVQEISVTIMIRYIDCEILGKRAFGFKH